MPKSGEPDDLQFSLDEIIAEVKSERTVVRPADSDIPQNNIDIDLDAPVWGHMPAHAAGVPSQDREAPQERVAAGEEDQYRLANTPQPETKIPAHVEASRILEEKGRHTFPDSPSPIESILGSIPEPAEEPACKEPLHETTAPWRTAPYRPAPPPPEPEPAPEEEPVKKQKPSLPYDLMNTPTDDPEEAVAHLTKAMTSISSRMLLMLPVIVTSLYMTVSGLLKLPMPFGFNYLEHPFLYMLAFCILQGLALLLAAPSTGAGLWRLLHGRPTLDTLVLFSGLSSLAHSISIIVKPEWGGYLPYTCVSALTCLFALQQKRQRAAALRRSYKAVLMGTVPVGIKLHVDGNRIATAVRTTAGSYTEISELAQPDTTERFSQYYAPLAMVCCIAFAAVASFGTGDGGRFLWALAAIASVSTPANLLISASAPGKRLGKKLFTSGSMLLNGQAAQRLSKARALVVGDGDLFPAGSVTLTGMKIADNQSPETVIACAAAMVQEIPGGLSRTFSDLARQQYIPPLKAEELRFFESGGVSAKVGGSYALLGSAGFLMRMGVRVTEGLQLKNSLFLSIDGAFAGIFSMRYGVQPPVYAAFGLLHRARIRPVLALRDFITTQAFVEEHFELRSDSTEYPVLAERMELSSPSYAQELPTLALLSRDGLLPAAEAVAAAARLTRAARFTRYLGLVTAAVGMLLLYFLTYRGAFAAAAPYNVLLYLLLWSLPSDLISCVVTRL